MTWLVVAYLGALAAMLVTSFYKLDGFTGATIKEFGLQNFQEINNKEVYFSVVVRTLLVALAVTVIDLLLAVPISFYLAKIATPKVRRILSVAVTMPLWASYLVKAYAWRTFVDPGDGLIKKVFGVTPGLGLVSTTIVLAYLWLPYAILPIYSGLERLPDSLLEASADLGGHAWVTFRKVVIPVLGPALVAGSIFTFSLSLGDYIAVGLVGGKTQMIGTVVNSYFVQNGPLAAAVSLIPMAIMLVYLLGARKSGALDNL